MNEELFAYIDPSPQATTQGALKGTTFVIQPNIAAADWPAQAGTRGLENYHALEDATVVRRLRQAGAHIACSARMNELGFGLAQDKAAQALSSSRADAALKIDMMGESRLAAALRGLYGFKPSAGIISSFGLIGLAPSMESCGIIAADPDIMAAALDVMAGKDDSDFSMDEGETPSFAHFQEEGARLKTIGIIRQSLALLAQPEKSIFENGLQKLESMGFEIKESSFEDFGYFARVHQCMASVEASSSCGKYDGVRYGHRASQTKNWNEMYLRSRGESFGGLIKAYLFQGAYFQFQNYAAFENAARIRGRLIEAAQHLFSQCDALAFPARCRKSSAAESRIADVYDEFALTLAANVLGTPAIQIPGVMTDGSTDLGLQLMAARLCDARLIGAASRIHKSVFGGK